jgi:hypothetical protein
MPYVIICLSISKQFLIDDIHAFYKLYLDDADRIMGLKQIYAHYHLEFNTEERVLPVQSHLFAHIALHDNSTVINRFLTDHLWIYMYINRLEKASLSISR